jgi:hypothetical protein
LFEGGRQSHTNYSRVAASRIQIILGWPPVAYKIVLRWQIPSDSTHGPRDWRHPGKICLRLAARNETTETNWPPVAC